MLNPDSVNSFARIQSACDRLAISEHNEQRSSLEELSEAILAHFNETYDSSASERLFSRELSVPTQRFAAVWLVRCLTKSSSSLDFGDTERLAADLFDRAFQGNVYNRINIEKRRQTFEKVQALEGHLHSVLNEAEALVSVPPNLTQLSSFMPRVLALFNNNRNQPFFTHLLPASLLHQTRITNLFQTITDYADNQDDDPIYKRDAAIEACEEFEREAGEFSTTDADQILGGLARQLRTAVADHFKSLEAGKNPVLEFSPINKKYPLERLGSTIPFRIKVTNSGTGPARDLRLEEVESDECLGVQASSTGLGTIQSGETLVFDIFAEVLAASTGATVLAEFSWSSPTGRINETQTFHVLAQRRDVDWSGVEYSEPYSLEPVATEDDLIGRKAELTRLLRLAGNQSVGSGFIFGQKRVGKTSLANAVGKSLESRSDINWVVINKGSGDYVGGDALSTLRTMGEVLAQTVIDRVPQLSGASLPDFSDGLSPLSRLMDQALAQSDNRFLFILDEFDELPPELFRRTDLATALFNRYGKSATNVGAAFSS